MPNCVKIRFLSKSIRRLEKIFKPLIENAPDVDICKVRGLKNNCLQCHAPISRVFTRYFFKSKVVQNDSNIGNRNSFPPGSFISYISIRSNAQNDEMTVYVFCMFVLMRIRVYICYQKTCVGKMHYINSVVARMYILR